MDWNCIVNVWSSEWITHDASLCRTLGISKWWGLTNCCRNTIFSEIFMAVTASLVEVPTCSQTIWSWHTSPGPSAKKTHQGSCEWRWKQWLVGLHRVGPEHSISARKAWTLLRGGAVAQVPAMSWWTCTCSPARRRSGPGAAIRRQGHGLWRGRPHARTTPPQHVRDSASWLRARATGVGDRAFLQCGCGGAEGGG